ncbi:hypothetical protein MTR67_031624 [Solanum verrucosum]|uniref:Uncharacterized protein n=1 Tax=Solanum verrucosum TaxID=315347 RepID=A0AAF0ZHW6_SOLVR|nr:hypothetical protein MTR67_031624 [Solanum verrucosum]
MSGLTFSTRSYMFRAVREGASFQSIMSTTKETELIVREEFGGHKSERSSGQFSDASSGGRGEAHLVHSSNLRSDWDVGYLIQQCPLQTHSGPNLLIQLLQLEVQRLRPRFGAEVSPVEVVGLMLVVLQLNRAEARVLLKLEVVERDNVNLEGYELEYDITILYHPGKANAVVDALSMKTSSMESLAFISVEERPLARNILRLADSLIRVQISEESGGLIAFIEVWSSLFEKIRERQFDDEKLCLILEKVLRWEAKKGFLDSDGILRIRGMICVPKKITMDFVVGLPTTMGCYDSIWMVVDRLTKSAKFTLVLVRDTAEKLAQL